MGIINQQTSLRGCYLVLKLIVWMIFPKKVWGMPKSQQNCHRASLMIHGGVFHIWQASHNEFPILDPQYTIIPSPPKKLLSTIIWDSKDPQHQCPKFRLSDCHHFPECFFIFPTFPQLSCSSMIFNTFPNLFQEFPQVCPIFFHELPQVFPIFSPSSSPIFPSSRHLPCLPAPASQRSRPSTGSVAWNALQRHQWRAVRPRPDAQERFLYLINKNLAWLVMKWDIYTIYLIYWWITIWLWLTVCHGKIHHF